MALRTTRREKPPSLVPAPVAGLASLIIPGLGQALAREVWRGLLLLGSLATAIGLFAWRVSVLAPRLEGLVAKFEKAFSRRPFFAKKPAPTTSVASTSMMRVVAYRATVRRNRRRTSTRVGTSGSARAMGRTMYPTGIAS